MAISISQYFREFMTGNKSKYLFILITVIYGFSLLPFGERYTTPVHMDLIALILSVQDLNKVTNSTTSDFGSVFAKSIDTLHGVAGLNVMILASNSQTGDELPVLLIIPSKPFYLKSSNIIPETPSFLTNISYVTSNNSYQSIFLIPETPPPIVS